jgi:hypothetical protein
MSGSHGHAWQTAPSGYKQQRIVQVLGVLTSDARRLPLIDQRRGRSIASAATQCRALRSPASPNFAMGRRPTPPMHQYPKVPAEPSVWLRLLTVAGAAGKVVTRGRLGDPNAGNGIRSTGSGQQPRRDNTCAKRYSRSSRSQDYPFR